ncbi:hypothetical protein NP233_g6810 [Leucocoprinus birnbaumii]|uniref:Uncharacterized protein n=1 Tax=Leucocoprinus birnbaumii TaxID=56174 RepID=A0AAD5VQI9_9AGAR|nr:hypothetical protein NP233_g6810 [Leucocoprinus birnbaumii]
MFSSFRRNRGRRNSTNTTSDTSSDHQHQQGTPPGGGQPPSQPNQIRAGNGGTDLHDGDYARKCRALMALLRDLRNLGADSVFDLPKIVVIGSQSAGKSSLIEAVTGITVPRDSGTCTRCPMECTLSSVPGTWSCCISLRTGVAGQFSDSERFGPVITDKGQVELWLRRAQAAVLSTDADKSQWLNKSRDQITQAIEAGTGMRKFTEDTVVIDIRDQGLTDLSFVDLPGLIQNADQESIDLVANLSRFHIQGENTLILVTIPVTDDIQNAGAVTLARIADPEGLRTIVVLTKPDLLVEGNTGAQENWRRTMQNDPGNRDYLQHGYYCIRLPNDEMRRRGLTAYNLPNANYFDVTQPWSQVPHRGRFGVGNLVRDVSTLLVQLIERNLPSLRDAIERELKACMERLARLPPAPQGDPMIKITLLLNEFLRQIGTASVGHSDKSLAQACRKRYEQLREEIMATCPEFRQKNEEDGDNVYDVAAIRGLIDDCTGWELLGFVPYETYERLIQRFLDGWESPMEECFEDIFTEFTSFVEQLTDQHFSGYRNLKLSHARTELEKRKTDMEIAARKLLEVEKQPFFSQRGDFKEQREKWLRVFDGIFHGERARCSHGYYYRLDEYGMYRDELLVMATVRTYFQFASERFSDTMLLMVERELVQALKAGLETTLFSSLVQMNRRGAEKSLLSEDPNHERERRELGSRKGRLTEIRRMLDEFLMS